MAFDFKKGIASVAPAAFGGLGAAYLGAKGLQKVNQDKNRQLGDIAGRDINFLSGATEADLNQTRDLIRKRMGERGGIDEAKQAQLAGNVRQTFEQQAGMGIGGRDNSIRAAMQRNISRQGQGYQADAARNLAEQDRQLKDKFNLENIALAQDYMKQRYGIDAGISKLAQQRLGDYMKVKQGYQQLVGSLVSAPLSLGGTLLGGAFGGPGGAAAGGAAGSSLGQVGAGMAQGG